MFGFLKKLFRRAPTEEATLRAICRGDEAQMRRLIDREKRRKPSLSELGALRAAIASYKQDQR